MTSSLEEAILRHLGAILSVLRAILGHLGAILVALGAILGLSWGHYEAILDPLRPAWAISGPSWAILGPSWANLGPSWRLRLECINLYTIDELRRAIFGHLGGSWGPCWGHVGGLEIYLGD